MINHKFKRPFMFDEVENILKRLQYTDFATIKKNIDASDEAIYLVLEILIRVEHKVDITHDGFYYLKNPCTEVNQ